MNIDPGLMFHTQWEYSIDPCRHGDVKSMDIISCLESLTPQDGLFISFDPKANPDNGLI